MGSLVNGVVGPFETRVGGGTTGSRLVDERKSSGNPKPRSGEYTDTRVYLGLRPGGVGNSGYETGVRRTWYEKEWIIDRCAYRFGQESWGLETETLTVVTTV